MQQQLNGMGTTVPYSPSLLKSAIQKAVRRGDVDKALACTKSLIDKDPRACLRRLMVIVLEDGLLLPNYQELALLTDHIRLKGSSLTEQDKTNVLTMVAELTRCEYRDFDKNNPDYAEGYQVAKLEDDELALVNAINYRVRIGGYKGDLDMLRNYARIWQKRFGEGSWNVERLQSYFTGEVVEYADVPYATNEDIPIEAIDFHCSPIGRILLKKQYVTELIQKAMPSDTRDWAEPWTSDEDMLNKVVWALRSGVNFKSVIWSGKHVDWLVADQIPEQYRDDFRTIYSRIHDELDGLAHWYLSKVNPQ